MPQRIIRTFTSFNLPFTDPLGFTTVLMIINEALSKEIRDVISLNVPTSALTAVIKVGENEMLYKCNTKLHQFAVDIFVS